MRDIKFRAWSTRVEEMHYRVENTFDDDPRGMFSSKNDNIACCFWELISSDSRKVMQYTWLKDILNREIYEWDIVTGYLSTPVEIYYENWSFSLWMWYLHDFYKKIQVVWNIYENPELWYSNQND